MKQVNSEILYIKPNDVIMLTFGKDYDLEEAEHVARRVAEQFPNNKFIMNLEGLITDIKIIKEDVPFVTGLTTADYMPPTSWTTSSLSSEEGYKELKINDYLY